VFSKLPLIGCRIARSLRKSAQVFHGGKFAENGTEWGFRTGLLRLKAGCFKMYDAEGEQISVLEYGKELNEWESISVECYYKQGNDLKPF